MYTTQDLRNMSEKDLIKELESARKELSDLSLRVRIGQEKKTHKIKELKSYVARILTCITEAVKEINTQAVKIVKTKPKNKKPSNS